MENRVWVRCIHCEANSQAKQFQRTSNVPSHTCPNCGSSWSQNLLIATTEGTSPSLGHMGTIQESLQVVWLQTR